MMIIPATPPACGAPRSAHAQSSRKRATIVAAVLPLATAFMLAGALTATAATALTSNRVTSVADFYSAPCGGKKPGVCPDFGDKQVDDSGQVSDRNGGTDTTAGRTSVIY